MGGCTKTAGRNYISVKFNYRYDYGKKGVLYLLIKDLLLK